jgi:hypothetical protein
MSLFKKQKRTLKRFLKDTAGSFGMIWGVAGLGVVISVGAAYDINQVSKAKQIAQMAADNMALTASIAVDTNNDDRYVDGQGYTYRYLGGPTDDFTDSMVGVVEYDVDDDGDGESNLLARATVSGTYQTAFAAALGIEALSFSASSDVAYAQVEGTPASVFFAVDNSGSMGWSDATGAIKLSALETSLSSFMTTLETINSDANDVYRTALWPYSQDYNGNYPFISDDGIITNKDVPPTWGGLTNGEITRMNATYGTDSSGSLEAAADAFALEDAVHLAKNGKNDPLKFMVFMSDGANNPQSEWLCPTISVDEYWVDTYRNWNTVYTSSRSWFDSWVIYYPPSGGPYEIEGSCGWEETFKSDERSLAACTAMKDAGVTVYTIGYYLVVSHSVSQAEVDRAQALLSGCATDADHYILAENASDLNTALATISEQVMTEVIRVKS